MLNKVANKIAVIVIAVLVIAFAIFSYISYQKTKDSMMNLSKQSKATLAQTAQIYLDRFLDPGIRAVNESVRYFEAYPDFLTTPYGKANLKTEMPRMSATAVSDELFIGFLDDGALRSVTFPKDSLPKYYELTLEKDNYDARNRGWLKKAIETGKLEVTTPYVSSTASQALVTSVVKVIKVDGKNIAVMGSDIVLTNLKDAVANMKDSETGVIAIVDPVSQKFVHHPNPDLVMSDSEAAKKGVSIWINGYKEHGKNAFEYSFGGVDKIGACQVSESSGWLVCSSSNISDYDAALNEALTTQVVFSIIFVILIVVILVFAITRFLRPLGSISNGLNSFFKFLNYEIKEPVSIPVSSKDEFGVMATLVNDNIAKIQDGKRLENEFISQANNFVDKIKAGDFTATLNANV
ncbi:hypothetical protein U5B43_09065, partial [Campylobacter sp. 9BO]|uniref:PDC sensor domain-containing protein n=1 Tax=Campylobacter sp. 9BO TaxID=3424759 RepID=UPI003D357A01